MSFSSACAKVGKQVTRTHQGVRTHFQRKEKFVPKELKEPSERWAQKARNFLHSSHQYLLKHPYLLNQEKDRGLTERSIATFRLGYNPLDSFEARELWGLSSTSSEGGTHLLCLPQGIVIPSFHKHLLIRLKIRRHHWKPNDKYPKYHIVAGSMTCPTVYGDIEKPMVIVEAELDAMLIQQFAGDICCCISLGGVNIRPDTTVDSILRRSQIILYALDFDEAGRKAFLFWRKTYPQLRPWPVPKGKSPGDAFKEHGVDLRSWIKRGITRAAQSHANGMA